MAIEYSKVGWDVAPYKYANPDNMNKMDTGIKSAVDGVNALEYVPKALASNGYGEQSGSRNLADWQKASHNIYTYSDGTASNSSYYQGILQKYYVHGETVRLNYKTNSQLTASAWCAITLYDVSGNYTRNVGASAKTLSVTPNDNEYYASFVLYGQSGVPASAYEEVMFTTDSDTTYEPYYESNKILTEDVNEVQSLKYLGWTVPKQLAVKNVAKVGGGLHQRVGRVDLGTLNWVNNNGYFYNLNGISYKATSNSIPFNAYTSKYVTKSLDYIASQVGDKCIGASYDVYLCIRDTSYSDATALRNALSGQYLYYELGTSVEIEEGNEFAPTSYNLTFNFNMFATVARKQLSVVWLNFVVSDTLSAGVNHTIVTLPKELRPPARHLVQATVNGTPNGFAWINTDGTVTMACNTSAQYLGINCTYIV